VSFKRGIAKLQISLQTRELLIHVHNWMFYWQVTRIQFHCIIFFDSKFLSIFWWIGILNTRRNHMRRYRDGNEITRWMCNCIRKYLFRVIDEAAYRVSRSSQKALGTSHQKSPSKFYYKTTPQVCANVYKCYKYDLPNQFI